MKKYLFAFVVLFLCVLAFAAKADNRLRPNISIGEMAELSSGSIGAGDFAMIYDASANEWKKVDATAYPSTGGAFNGTVGATTPSTGEFTTVTASTSVAVGGVTQPILRKATDAVASGQTSKAATVTGITAASLCVASLNEVASNSVSVRAVVATTNTATVTLSGDPGASNADFTVICAN